MTTGKPRVIVGIAVLSTLLIWGCTRKEKAPSAWSKIPTPPNHVSHAAFFKGDFKSGPEVTQACLGCHEDAAKEVMHTSHWTWKGAPAEVPGHKGKLELGKANLINNFCIGVQSNWPGCTRCHAGYGWADSDFDFQAEDKVDCLACHDHSGGYIKGEAGLPADPESLLAAAKSVGRPTRSNCGACHFDGGGGDGVKHGDLDRTLMFPSARIDAHMGKHKLECVDCHQTHQHRILGRSMSVSTVNTERAYCTDCHSPAPHLEARLNAHTEAVACPTCHIPEMAVETPTKMTWDWSTAGEDRKEDVHSYLKIKGSFTYQKKQRPEYHWYNGSSSRYLLGEKIDPSQVTQMAWPIGSIQDPSAKIWPFKVHRGRQVYDKGNLSFLVPKTVGNGGFWTEFDWDKALRLGAEDSGQPYTGSYGFAETEMAWPLAHMVATKDKSLACQDCHSEHGRLDWEALGYLGDPAETGARRRAKAAIASSKGGRR